MQQAFPALDCCEVFPCMSSLLSRFTGNPHYCDSPGIVTWRLSAQALLPGQRTYSKWVSLSYFRFAMVPSSVCPAMIGHQPDAVKRRMAMWHFHNDTWQCPDQEETETPDSKKLMLAYAAFSQALQSHTASVDDLLRLRHAVVPNHPP